jgi:hypothetical protein
MHDRAGPSPVTLDQVLLGLLDQIPSVSLTQTQAEWTRWFHETAADLVVQGRPHYGRCGRGRGWDPEYLADVTVSQDLPDSRHDDPFGYTHLVFAMEIEWSTDEWGRGYDFCKLADVRADLKLYVCEVPRWVWNEVGPVLVDRFAKFWNQHVLVQPEETVGLMVTSKSDVGAWVLRKGSTPALVRRS